MVAVILRNVTNVIISWLAFIIFSSDGECRNVVTMNPYSFPQTLSNETYRIKLSTGLELKLTTTRVQHVDIDLIIILEQLKSSQVYDKVRVAKSFSFLCFCLLILNRSRL